MAKRNNKKKTPITPAAPHDSLFKLTFGTKEIVLDYMNTFFPPELLEGMDKTAMRLVSNTYIDETLKNHLSDVVWMVPYKGIEIWPVFLFEHKSNPDSHVLVQVLRYMLCVWEHDLREKKGAKLRVVVPIIVYHGEEKWEMKPFESLFGDVPEDLKKYIPRFDYLFEKLHDIPDKVLMALENASTFAALVTLARAFHPAFFDIYFPEATHRLNKGRLSVLKRNLLTAILVYMYTVSKMEAEEMMTIIEKLPSPLNSTNMNTYEKIVEKGRKEGIQLKNRETIRKGVKKGMSINDLADLTDLPESKVIEIIEQLKQEGEL